jgi:proline racemase
MGEPFRNEGVAGEQFIGKVVSADENTVTTTIQGSAYHYATSTFVLDSRDSLGNGFQLR